jgi:nicotinate phosphoribosyltransferase
MEFIMTLWAQYRPELVTDLYEFTMAASYWQEGMSGEATFSLFIRKYPPNRAYFVAAGLEHLVEVISNFRFTQESLNYLEASQHFAPGFLQYLEGLRFTGTLRGLPEGTLFFADEPIVEVTGPIIEAQIVETIVMNIVHLETMIASKAARCMHAAGGRGLVDFSLRRTQGVDAGVKVARASYIAGFMGTSNTLAGKIYGIPVFGTMAHSYVTSFSTELDAFRAYARAFPDHTVLLVDTYDTLSGADKALEVARELETQGYRLRAVRLDSGDLLQLSRDVRARFRQAGFGDVGIMVSGSLDEYRLDELLQGGAEIDWVGIGTHMGVSADAPYLDMAYKMVEYDGRPILKLSPGKKSWVGKKQVFRFYDEERKMCRDILGLEPESYADAAPLLEVFIRDGRRERPGEDLARIRERFGRSWQTLPETYRDLRPVARYPVDISRSLEELQLQVAERRMRDEIGPGH